MADTSYIIYPFETAVVILLKKSYIIRRLGKNTGQKIFKKVLANWLNIVYIRRCCGMIAMKREVAALVAGFPWSECQVRKLTTSHCTSNV